MGVKKGRPLFTPTAGLIGEGTHQRAVITVDRFMDKCQAKLG